MTRVWNTAIFAIAAAYFIIDGLLSHATRPITAWLGKKKLLEKLRRWATSFGPYPSLALFAVPVIILEPAKPVSAYLLGTGHYFAAALIFVAAEVLKLTVVERLFHLNKKKLLSIPAFAWVYGYWRRMMDLLESTRAWRMARRLAIDSADWVRRMRLKLKFYAKRVARILLPASRIVVQDRSSVTARDVALLRGHLSRRRRPRSDVAAPTAT